MSSRDQATPNPAPEERWGSLTWDDIDAWAGTRSMEKGRGYQRAGRVRDLVRAEDGTLLAWVVGTARYVTRVELTAEPTRRAALQSKCTCPLQIGGCKHAVAVVLAYLDALKQGRTAPVASPTDPRWELLRSGVRTVVPAYEEPDAEDYEPDPDEEPVARRARPKRADNDGIRRYLEGLPAADLVRYILDIADRYPEVAEELATRGQLSRGRADELVREARKEIGRLTSQEAWYDSWQNRGSLPDYGGLQKRLERLLELGQADAVLDLGQSLFTAGHQQVGSSNDEGETAGEIGDCLGVVFRAVPTSSRSDADKLLYVLDMTREDDYDICNQADVVFDQQWPAEAWSKVADVLAQRLCEFPEDREDSSHRNYTRDRLSNQLISALEESGRHDEVLAVCEAEAPITDSYERLVRHFIADRKLEEAKKWAREGIERVGVKWPGIANHLRESLREVARLQKDWTTLAGLEAEEFFERPSVQKFEAVLNAAEKLGCAPAAREAALEFLETGVRPPPASSAVSKRSPRTAKGKTKKQSESATWPIPDVSTKPTARAVEPKPYFDVLLEIAMKEKRPDDVLRWYDRLAATGRGRGFGWNPAGQYASRVADAVAATHPERSLAIWKGIIASHIAQVSPASYEAAAPYLRKVRDLLHTLGRATEWARYLAELRKEHQRKRRLLEVLDRLQARRIVEN